MMARQRRLIWRARIGAGLVSRTQEIGGGCRYAVAEILPNLAERTFDCLHRSGFVMGRTGVGYLREAVGGAEDEIASKGLRGVFGGRGPVQKRQDRLEKQREGREPDPEQRYASGLPDKGRVSRGRIRPPVEGGAL